MVQELKIKDEIIRKWQKKNNRILEELKMAKIVLSDRNLSQLAAKDFKNVIADIEKDTLCREGFEINDIIDKWTQQKLSFEVTQDRFTKKPDDKNELKIKTAGTDDRSISKPIPDRGGLKS